MTDVIIIKVPDIGSTNRVDVIELLVKVGDVIAENSPLLVLESDKASMEIPSPYAGKVIALHSKIGDKVQAGDDILTLEPAAEIQKQAASILAIDLPVLPVNTVKSVLNPVIDLSEERTHDVPKNDLSIIAAGPAVRRMARELGIDLSCVIGRGRKNRITKEDLQQYVKNCLNTVNPNNITNTFIDFSVFGEIKSQPLSKIKKLTAVNVHRSWLTVPQVTQFDEADITSLEEFRRYETGLLTDCKLTLLSFVIKSVTKALLIYPQFNASLDANGQNLIYKYYYNIGVAVETPNGLVVPVVHGVDKLSIVEIAKQLNVLSQKARDKNLLPQHMTGGNFTISSLGGIAGTAFTPIVNNPEVAILGISRSSIKPIYINNEFQPRLMLPLSLSYDHRVIDGAEAARFMKTLTELLGDMRRVLL